MIFFISINIIGLVCNLYLYHIDRRDYDGILHRVDQGERIVDLISEPVVDGETQDRKDILRSTIDKSGQRRTLVDYKLDDSFRNTLSRIVTTKGVTQ